MDFYNNHINFVSSKAIKEIKKQKLPENNELNLINSIKTVVNYTTILRIPEKRLNSFASELIKNGQLFSEEIIPYLSVLDQSEFDHFQDHSRDWNKSFLKKLMQLNEDATIALKSGNLINIYNSYREKP